MNRRLLLLTLCQGLFLVNNVVFIAINGLVGMSLAPSVWLATLPVTGYVAGGAMATALVARHQRRYGRRRTFQMGLGAAMVASMICATAALSHNFWLLMLGTVIAGYYQANASLYRFAAVELVEPSHKERAISWVLAGGILGGVVGPNMATYTRDILPAPFAGAYVALVGVALLGMLVVSMIDFPTLPGQGDMHPQRLGRPLREIARQPLFIAAAASGAVGYGVMNLLMAATPIAMAQCKHPFSDAALVLEWHVLGMFVPSFFTGHLIKRFGVMPIIASGLLLNAACIAFALSGQDVMHFLGALFVLGVGWNFLFIGGTTLATRTYTADERTRAQAALDFCIAATMAVTSFSSGALVTTGGWTAMNQGSILPLTALILVLLWAHHRHRSAPPALGRAV